MHIIFEGEVLATPTAATILIDGQEVFSGQVGSGQPLDAPIILANVASEGGAVSISVTSGILNVGTVLKWPDAPAWDVSAPYPANSVVTYNGDTWTNSSDNPAGKIPGNAYPGLTVWWTNYELIAVDARQNILINGQPPVWPATPPVPEGTEQDPDWAGWSFEVSAGETITFTV